MLRMTPSELRIAQFILDHPDDVVAYSIQVLAQKIQTSPATLVRFSRSIGYSGFPELKIDLSRNDQFYKEDLIQDLKRTDSLKALISKTFHHRMHNLENLLEILNYEHLEQSINFLKEAKTIYLVGVGASGLVCRDLYHKFTRIGKNAVYNSDTHVSLSVLNGITEEDVLIAVSYSGNTKEIVLAAQLAKEKGSKVIAITQRQKNIKNMLIKYVDTLCQVPSCEQDLRVGAIDSRDASLYFADLLYLGVAWSNYDMMTEKLKESRKIVQQL